MYVALQVFRFGGAAKLLMRAYSALSESNVARDRIVLRASATAFSSGRRRITIVCNDADYFLRHRRTTADALAEAGHRVCVITGGRPIAPEQRGRWDYVNVPIERWTFAPRADLRLVIETFREVLRKKPDTLHLITLKPIVFSGIAAILARIISGRRTRIVATVPGLGRLMSPASSMKSGIECLSRFLVDRAVRVIARRKDVRFTFETASDHATWVGGGMVPSAKAMVISGAGVDPREFHPRRSRADGQPLRVLFASRLLKSKGLDVFIAAARKLKDCDVEFLVAGMLDASDPDAVPLEELENEASIRFLGRCNDMPSLLREVDVVALPTRYGEGIPRILIEAAATGIPSIASDHEGCREIVEDGETGVIVPEKPVDAASRALAKAILRYRDDPALRQKHGDAARRRFLDGDYAEDNVVAQFVELLVGQRA